MCNFFSLLFADAGCNRFRLFSYYENYNLSLLFLLEENIIFGMQRHSSHFFCWLIEIIIRYLNSRSTAKTIVVDGKKIFFIHSLDDASGSSIARFIGMWRSLKIEFILVILANKVAHRISALPMESRARFGCKF
jgi:hypothetical protein